MAKTVRLIIMLACCLTLALEACAHTVITRVSDRQSVSFSQLLADAERSDLVLIGEAHDNKQHHEMQLALIRSLFARNLPLAIGLEMMESDNQQQLDDWIEGRLSEQSFQTVFADNWSDWPLYREIFVFARNNRIPMVALNVPKELVKKVAQHGFASLTPAERKNLPQGTSCDLNNPHTEFLKKSFQDVFKHVTSGKVFIHFCEAQTLRNSGMAMNIASYARKQPGRKIVALTGIWHAVKSAVPEQLERNGSKVSSTVILPELPELTSVNATADEVDYLIDQ